MKEDNKDDIKAEKGRIIDILIMLSKGEMKNVKFIYDDLIWKYSEKEGSIINLKTRESFGKRYNLDMRINDEIIILRKKLPF